MIRSILILCSLLSGMLPAIPMLGQSGHTAIDTLLITFKEIRRSQNIDSEFNYASKIAQAAFADTTLTTYALKTLEQLAADDERLLPKKPDKDQLEHIMNIGNVAIGFYVNNQQQAAISTELMAIGVNRKLHQHQTGPYFTLAHLYLATGKSKEALAVALEAVKVGETVEGPIDCFGYEAAARVYYTTGDYDKVLEYYYKTVPYFLKKPGMVYDAGNLFYRAIQIMLQRHKPAEALKAVELFKRRLNVSEPGKKENEMRYYLLAKGNYFHAVGNNDSAEQSYLRSLNYLPAGLNNGRIAILFTMASFYVDLRQYARARPLLDTLTSDAARPYVSFEPLESSWQLRYRTDSGLRDYRQAMLSLHHYLLIHDSLVNVTKNRQLAEMNVQFETDKMNQHITDLEKQTALQKRLQQSTDRQNRIVRTALIAGSLILMLLLAVVINRNRLKQRSNALLAARQQELDTRQQQLDESNHRLVELNGRQERLLEEKEWLMREIHHRVKNNLQVVISLLNMQTSTLKDELALNAVVDIRSRIRAISLIHQRLYQEDQDITRIDMPDYVNELAGFLEESFGLRQRIRLRLDIDPVDLDVSQCVPLGLILNEAVTNSIKYAFPVESVAADATITIFLKKEAENNLHLLVSDNGIGLPPSFDIEVTRSMGFRLIRTLTLQLNGSVVLDSQSGLHISIRFPLQPASAGQLETCAYRDKARANIFRAT